MAVAIESDENKFADADSPAARPLSDELLWMVRAREPSQLCGGDEFTCAYTADEELLVAD